VGVRERGERALREEEAATRDGSGRKTTEDWGVVRCFLPFASAVPLTLAGCLGGCGVLEEEAGKSGSGDAQRTRLTLLPLLPPALPSE
jgi:hypothetical protein